MLTKKQLEEIKGRAGKATKGPWIVGFPGYGFPCVTTVKGDPVVASGKDRFGEPNKLSDDDIMDGIHNTEFIAHARNDVPALLSDNDALRGEVERLKAAVRFGLSFASTVSDWMDEVEVNGEMLSVYEVKERLEEALSQEAPDEA